MPNYELITLICEYRCIRDSIPDCHVWVSLLIKNQQANISNYKGCYVEKTVKVLKYRKSREKHVTVISTTSGQVILYVHFIQCS